MLHALASLAALGLVLAFLHAVLGDDEDDGPGGWT